MKTTRLFLVTALCCQTATATGAAGKPNTTASVALNVAFDDSEAMRITSDGLYSGTYSDGIDGVAASFDQYGNLIINFQTTRTPLRKVHYNYDAPLDPVDARPAVTPPSNYMSTVRRPGEGPLQALALGASQCVMGYLTYANDANTIQYRVSFQRATGSIDVTATSFLRVTRTVAGWEVTSDGQIDAWGKCVSGYDPVVATPGAHAAKLIETPLRGTWAFVDDGHFDMPMKLTLTAK